MRECSVSSNRQRTRRVLWGVGGPHGDSGALQVAAATLIALLLSGPGPSRAQSVGAFRLVGVSVVGSERYKEPELVQATSLRLGQALAPDALNEAANRLATTGAFAEVKYRYETRGDGMTVVFTVHDAAGLLPCTFENLVWFSPQELLQELRARVPLFDGYSPVRGEMLDLISAQLGALLEARGIHAQIQVSPQGPLGGPVQSMQFREVGVPLPVRRIEFTGIEKVDAASLQQAAQPLLSKDYDASFIREFSRRALVAVYRQHGYLRAAFGEPVPKLLADDPTPNSVAVSIPVTEGEEFRLKEITWSGESAIPYGELAKSLHVAIGSPVNAIQLEQDVLSLILLFHPKGYLNANTSSKAVLDDAAHSAVYQIEIRQGDLYRLGKLEIAGLDDAHAGLVEGLSRLRPGDPYDGTYWNKFVQEVSRRLPPNQSGWKLRADPTIHADTKTVDVRLTFSPRASH